MKVKSYILIVHHNYILQITNGCSDFKFQNVIIDNVYSSYVIIVKLFLVALRKCFILYICIRFLIYILLSFTFINLNYFIIVFLFLIIIF